MKDRELGFRLYSKKCIRMKQEGRTSKYSSTTPSHEAPQRKSDIDISHLLYSRISVLFYISFPSALSKISFIEFDGFLWIRMTQFAGLTQAESRQLRTERVVLFKMRTCRQRGIDQRSASVGKY